MNGGESNSFCTLSENTRHDPKAIVAHLEPVLTKYLLRKPHVDTIFYMSDGPVTQYRTRDLCILVTQYLTERFPQIRHIEWIFSESGHGKGEADGVGGTTKRTADNAVAHGQDVDSIEKLSALLSDRCPSVWYYVVKTEDIKKVDSVYVPETSVVKGTLKIHHWIWSKDRELEIVFKRLKCTSCTEVEGCDHFIIGGGPWIIPSKRGKAKFKKTAAQTKK